MSDATHGHGSELWINVGAGLVRVAEIDGIPDLPSFSTELYETTNFDTVAVKEFKKLPLKEGQEITITGNYVLGGAAYNTLTAADAEEEALAYRIVLLQGDETYHCDGESLFYNLTRTNPADEKRQFSITMKPTTDDTTAEVA